MRRRNFGYNDLGPTRIPPVQSFFAMVDRGTGTLWYLSHRSTDNRISINDTFPSAFQALDLFQYGAYDGPYIPSPRRDAILRLFVRDGRLGYEVVDLGHAVVDVDAAPVRSRKNFQLYALEVYHGNWEFDGDEIGWRLVYGTDGAADV